LDSLMTTPGIGAPDESRTTPTMLGAGCADTVAALKAGLMKQVSSSARRATNGSGDVPSNDADIRQNPIFIIHFNA
jgi:hypothetical protein